MSATKKILTVTIHHDVDTDPDTSWLGKYASDFGYKDQDDDPAKNKVIDRQERGDMNRDEYRYFIAANSGEDTGNPESVEQDYQRMESLNAGQWSFIGVWAEAEVQLGASDVVQRIRSGGLWGIESDSDDYIPTVEADELAALKAELVTLGFSESAIDAAYLGTAPIRRIRRRIKVRRFD